MGQLQKEADSNKNGFVLQGTLKSALSDKVYLSKITGNDIQPVDSAKIENNNFVFQGIVEHPERFFYLLKTHQQQSFLLLKTPILKFLLIQIKWKNQLLKVRN